MKLSAYVLTTVLLASAAFCFPDHHGHDNTINAGAVGAGGTAGASASSSGTSGSGVAYGVPPQQDFGSLLAGYFQALYNYHQLLLANAYARYKVDPSFNGDVSAKATFTYHGLQAQAQAMHQAALHAASHGYAGGYASGYVGGFAKPPFAPTFPVQPVYPVVPVASGLGDRHGGNAGATASLANGQGHQTAYLSDRNDPSKNVQQVDIGSRFNNGGTQGVSSFSSSSYSNVDGKETVHREASTTINDNGKLTTYTVKD